LINPSTYPTIAPIIKLLELNNVLVLQVDEVGNNPNNYRLDVSPMMAGLSPAWANRFTSLSLNLISRRAATRWREILGESQDVENYLPKNSPMLFAHPRDVDS